MAIDMRQTASPGARMYDDVQQLVDDAISKVGHDIVLGLPIAVGKPTHIGNEFYRRAKQNSKIKLIICSGLTLHTPRWKNDLERRFMEPLVARLFPDYPNPVFYSDALAGRLPQNVELREIYFSPGSSLGNDRMQQSYLSANFTHVPRDMDSAGCNVAAAMVSRRGDNYSLGSNCDAAITMIRLVREQIRNGKPAAVLGQVNSSMPFMFGDGELGSDAFTGIVDNRKLYHGLFAPQSG